MNFIIFEKLNTKNEIEINQINTNKEYFSN